MPKSTRSPSAARQSGKIVSALRRILNPEQERLIEEVRKKRDWALWGPYLPERQWATVREDYSVDGDCWKYFPHDHARSRAYRWGDDGLLGISDRECRLCFAPALWNGRDPILKERLFGLTGSEGNHGEDVKECYYYLEASPTGSYLKALYKYPQAAYPYDQLVAENHRRSRNDPEFELIDTGVFDDNRYFDVFVEYVQAGAEDILIRITACNRGPDAATLHLLPQLWFRNTWSWGRTGDGYWPKPKISQRDKLSVRVEHQTLGHYVLTASPPASNVAPPFLFTDNETNSERLWKIPNANPYVKDAFHRYLVGGERDAINPQRVGTKTAPYYQLEIPAGGEQVVKLRLCKHDELPNLDLDERFDRMFEQRRDEHDRYIHDLFRQVAVFYGTDPAKAIETDSDGRSKVKLFTDEGVKIIRQGIAGMIWSCQFYNYVVKDWLAGDPGSKPDAARRKGRNADWAHLYSSDIISMPDKWEYPWFAAWDLAFHTLSFAWIDSEFAKDQLELMLRDTYMHPNGQIPAYEFGFGDVNPPVHAWAAYRFYKMTATTGEADRIFLGGVFQRLLLNFSWWVNRKDPEGNNVFSGGFLGLDNIGVFDRSKPLPTGGQLQQADGTAWMAFYCASMLSIAFELAAADPTYADMAYKFLEHFASIIDAMHAIGGTGLWSEEDGFYYDQLVINGQHVPLRVRSLVGIIPLLAAAVLETSVMRKMPVFQERMDWLARNRPELARHFTLESNPRHPEQVRALLAVPSRERLVRVLRYVLDENEFLSPYGIRSISKYHKDHPFVFNAGGLEYRVDYLPAESNTGLFGGNSNWRGPIWVPINYLLIEALETYYLFYGDELKVEHPTGSGKMMNLKQVAEDLAARLASMFLPGADGRRPIHGDDRGYADDPHWKDLILFYEYFNGDTGKGLGANHQTGWTSLVMRCLRRATAEWQRFQVEPQGSMPDIESRTPAK